MDSLHFYLFHCYHIGIRTKKQDDNQAEEETKNNKYFDAAFSRINKIISERTYITKEFNRFSTKKNGKYNIKTQEDEMENIADNNTYLDEIYKHLQNNNIKATHVKKLNQFIQSEEYETDSIAYDIEIYDGNIDNAVASTTCIKQIKNFIETTTVSSTLYSVGLRFYYWNYYKNLNQLGTDEQVIGYSKVNNYNAHSG
eukprot:96616_1